MKSVFASSTGKKMWEVIRVITNRKQDGKDSAMRRRMATAFMGGMVITAALAYLPIIITALLSHEPGHESAVPAPSDAPDFLRPGSRPDGSYPEKHINYELVYAPLEEAIFSG